MSNPKHNSLARARDLYQPGVIAAPGLPPSADPEVTAAVTELPGAASEKRDRLIATSSEERKMYPMAEGLLDYFPDALAAVARHSFESNQKHNPGQPMHWARGKSMDHADCILRHLERRGLFDGAARESTALAWRSLALLQEELEAAYKLDPPRAAK